MQRRVDAHEQPNYVFSNNQIFPTHLTSEQFEAMRPAATTAQRKKKKNREILKNIQIL